MPDPSHDLVNKRERMLQEFAGLGDLRRATLTCQYRKCGKPTCRCANDDTSRHGPYWVISWCDTKTGKTRSRAIPADAAEQVKAQIAEYQRARNLVREFFDVCSQICDARLDDAAPGDRQKKGALRRSSPRRSRPKPRN